MSGEAAAQGPALAEEFEAHRAHLLAVAHRLLGPGGEAQDAVQEAWLRLHRTGPEGIDNLGGWLTTVVARVCLDVLRRRATRREEPLELHVVETAGGPDPETEAVLAESVGLALLVVLDVLTPPERLAFVLHDLFAAPFGEIATILGTSVDVAKKHASRARGRIASSRLNTELDPELPSRDATPVVDAFLAAARGGDLDAMVALLADDCVRVADRSLVPPDTPTVVRGARAVAEETTLFVDRIRASTPMWLGDRVVHVIAPGGHPLAVVDVVVVDDRVARVDIRRMTFATVSEWS